ncbi:MAG: hypothetical protein KJ600_00035 [Nanoarchaeota archaeon]|nr:hypothetical protein [Nanoarchaeota archaeon]
MSKTKRTPELVSTGLALLLGPATIGNPPVEPPFIKSIPASPTWKADGSTEYDVNVVVNNRNLGGQETMIVGWLLNNTPNLTYRSHAPTTGIGDFFNFPEGTQIPTDDAMVLGPGIVSGRFALQESGNPYNWDGTVTSYTFTVPTNTQLGTGYFFELAPYDTMLYGNDYSQQTGPEHVGYDTFTVIPDLDMVAFCTWGPEYVDKSSGERAPEFCMPYDRNGDGNVDLLDWAQYQIDVSTPIN